MVAISSDDPYIGGVFGGDQVVDTRSVKNTSRGGYS